LKPETLKIRGREYVRQCSAGGVIGKSRWTVMRWVAAGKLKAVRRGAEVWVCVEKVPGGPLDAVAHRGPRHYRKA
jgi:hypothetical protein